MYEDCRVYGPYKNSENRSHVIIIFPDGKRKTTQYCRYLMEKSLGKALSKEEDVHHKDGNFNNDSLDNLEIVDMRKHRGEHSQKTIEDIVEHCVWCGKEILLNKSKQRTRRVNIHKGKNGPFCSKKCIGTYGQRKQMEYRNKNP